MKLCRRCKIEKDESEFGKDKSKKDGLNIYCKECLRESSKKWQAKNKDILYDRQKKMADSESR